MLKIKFIICLVLTILILDSCNFNKMEGTYYYVDQKSNDIYTMGRDIGCSVIGKFEFKDGKCYVNIMGIEKRLDYEIENNVIYLKNYNESGETGLTIVDDNTISLMGCLFRKNNEDSVNQQTNLTKERKSLKSSLPEIILSDDTIDNQPALIKDIFDKNGKTYISLDIVQIRYINQTDYKIFNQNSKIRTFEVSEDVKITDNNCRTIDENDYLIKNRGRHISKKNDEICMFSSVDGIITEINFGCWN